MRRNGMAKQKHVFQIIVEQDEAGYFVAECPALRACYTQGKTYEEVIENTKDVIALCLEDLKAHRKGIPKQAKSHPLQGADQLAWFNYRQIGRAHAVISTR